MAPSRAGLALTRRGVGAALVLLLLVSAVVYPMVARSTARSAASPSTPATSAASEVASASPLTPTPRVSGTSESPTTAEKSIRVYGGSVTSARPFETVQIRGTYRGGAETFVRIEWREGTTWIAFPLQWKTDHAGRFIAYIDMGRPGPCWLRVQDPETGVTSEEFVVVIEG